MTPDVITLEKTSPELAFLPMWLESLALKVLLILYTNIKPRLKLAHFTVLPVRKISNISLAILLAHTITKTQPHISVGLILVVWDFKYLKLNQNKNKKIKTLGIIHYHFILWPQTSLNKCSNKKEKKNWIKKSPLLTPLRG